jgi:two-component system heavy metal sensor histidine kinase CusS
MSSTRAPLEGATPAPPPPSAGLFDSLALRIAVAISVVTAALMLAGCWMIGRLLEQEFTELQLAIAAEQRDAFIARAWRVILWTLAGGAAATSVLAWAIAQRILGSVRRLGDTANRIGAEDLHERLPADALPAELAPVAEAFNAMLERLQDAFARLSDFSTDLAHDLRAPIHRLLTATQVTLSQPRSADDYRAVLESAVSDYERIGRLIENILFLARADRAQTRLSRDWHGVPERLAMLAEFFELAGEERGVRIALDVQPGLRVWADDMLLSRAVGNLLSNAIRHARPDSVVTLSATSSAPGTARICVSNHGEPIAPHHHAAIFQRRYRVEPAIVDTHNGLGLGLSIVKSIMDLHGGSASVSSAPGQATTFTLNFPTPQRRRRLFRPIRSRSSP